MTAATASITTPTLKRTAFRTSRLLDFCSRKELIAQTGHQPEAWPLVVLKELIDNALDACEDADIAPEVSVKVNKAGITVEDNGPGLPPEIIEGVLDFGIRVSTREAYVSPCRGAQGNALKTIIAMPFVLSGERGEITIAACGIRHRIALEVDHIRQEPKIGHEQKPDENVKTGTSILVQWPDSACTEPDDGEGGFLQIDEDEDATSTPPTDPGVRFSQFAEDFAWLNPHLTLTVDWFGQRRRIEATDLGWQKWLPSNPTCPHWYGDEQFNRLVAAYIAHDADHDRDRTVRELVQEFRGLSGSAKQKRVLDATGMARMNLSELANGDGLQTKMTATLLASMKDQTKPVKPAALGLIGAEHLRQRFEAAGCELESFQYQKALEVADGLPEVIEVAFGWCPEVESRRLVTGVNWSPGILNPFRELGRFGDSLDASLSKLYVRSDEPVIVVVHGVCPRVEYTDRGKSAVVLR